MYVLTNDGSILWRHIRIVRHLPSGFVFLITLLQNKIFTLAKGTWPHRTQSQLITAANQLYIYVFYDVNAGGNTYYPLECMC